MGAIVDRLTITLFDARTWLKFSNSWTAVDVVVLDDPPADTEFSTSIDGTVFTVDSGATPTPASVGALLVAAIGAGSTGVAVTDLGSGKYRLTRATAFLLLLDSLGSGLQDIVPAVADDFILESLIVVAKQMADEYCNNPFTDADGNDEAVPDAVRTGVLQLVDWLYADYSSSSAASSGSAGPSGPIKKRKAGKVEITYATPGEVRASLGARGAISDLPSFAVNILAMYRLMPGYESAREPRQKPPGLAPMNDNIGFIPGTDYPPEGDEY